MGNQRRHRNTTRSRAESTRSRNRAADAFSGAHPDRVLQAALDVGPTVLTGAGAAGELQATLDTLAADLLRLGQVPVNLRELPTWQYGRAVAGFQVGGVTGSTAVVVRTRAPGPVPQRPAPAGCDLADVSEPAGEGQPLADLVLNLLGRTPAGDVSALALVVEAIPVSVAIETRRDRRVLPRVQVYERPGREAGMLIGGLHDGRRAPQRELPLWPEAPKTKRVPLLDLVDAAGVPVMARGKGAPLALRLLVRILVSVQPMHRHRQTVRIEPTLGEVVAGVFPTRFQPWRDWPRLRHALLTARDYGIVETGRLPWMPLALRRQLPDIMPPIDTLLAFDVAFPPGATSGPPVDLPELERLSVQSAPRWRAYIAAHSIAWLPGMTRVPRRRGGRFGWTRDVGAYPILTLADRRRLAFGGDEKHRTRAEVDRPFRELTAAPKPGGGSGADRRTETGGGGRAGLVLLTERAVDPRTGEVGWRIVPTEAAETIRAGAAADESDQGGGGGA